MKDMRLAALRRFATAITILNVAGRGLLGFEQSWLQWLVAIATAYGVDLLLETVDAWARRRRPAYFGEPMNLVNFLLPAHISGQAVSMLMYFNTRLWAVAFAVGLAIASKWIFRAPVGGRTRHFYNPSNFGIGITLLLFPWIGIAPPYHFVENISGAADWILPAGIVMIGTMLNAKYTLRLPLIGAWLGGFALQALLRASIAGTPFVAPLNPMTGLAFLLFTFYMISDPGTTPRGTRAQVIFGASVAATYGVLTTLHAVFGLFFALLIVCTIRGVVLLARASVPGSQPVATVTRIEAEVRS